MELIEKMAIAVAKADAKEGCTDILLGSQTYMEKAREVAQAALTALIEYAGRDGVTEEDCEAASVYHKDSFCTLPDCSCGADQAFARHRATAFAAGRAAREREIVEWLRGKIAEFEASHPDNWSLIDELTGAADAIEGGEV